MDAPAQTSFIPHESGSFAPSTRFGSSGGLSELVLLFSIVVFVASGALAGAVFLYHQYLTQQESSKVAQLKRAEAQFDPSFIAQMTQLDSRMNAANEILSMHTAPTVFFQALNQATLQTISFRTLQFDASDPKHIALKIAGVARSVNSIALQADILSKSGLITNPIFSGIDREADGVHFNLNASIDPTAISYQSFVASGGAAAADTSTMAVPAAASTSSVPTGPLMPPNAPQGEPSSQ